MLGQSLCLKFCHSSFPFGLKQLLPLPISGKNPPVPLPKKCFQGEKKNAKGAHRLWKAVSE